MDLNKQAEFERSIEQIVDSLPKAENPVLLYKMALMETLQKQSPQLFHKLSSEDVSLSDEVAAKVLHDLVRDSSDVERIGITNAMSEVYRTIGNPELPYQEELRAAIHAKLPVIEEKLKEAVEQQAIKRQMSQADPEGKAVYEHVQADPDVLSDALYGKSGDKFLSYALEQAISDHNAKTETPQQRKAEMPEFADALNKNAAEIEAKLLAEAKTKSAEKDSHHNPHISADERKAIREQAETAALAVTLLERTGRDDKLATTIKAEPKRFLDRLEATPEINKAKSMVTTSAIAYYNDTVQASKNKMPNCGTMPSMIQEAEKDVFAHSQLYAPLPKAEHEAASVMEQLNKGITEQATQTEVFRNAYSTVIGTQSESISIAAACAAEKVNALQFLEPAVDAEFGQGTFKQLSDTQIESLYLTYSGLADSNPMAYPEALAKQSVATEKDEITTDLDKNKNNKDITE